MRLAKLPDFDGGNLCQLCRARTGTLAHRHVCTVTTPPERWPAPNGEIADFMSSIGQRRAETLKQRGILVVAIRTQPRQVESAGWCWLSQPPDLTRDDLTFIAVGMLCGIDRSRATVADLTPRGQSMLENHQLGVISRREVWLFLLWMRGDGDRPSDDVLQRL